MRILKNVNAKKLKLINLIVNTDKLTVLKKLEEVFESELNYRWLDSVSETKLETNKHNIQDTDNSELFS